MLTSMEREQEDEVSEESFEPRDLARPLGGRNGGKVAGIEQVEEAENDSPDVTQEKLERVRRKLGIVRLSWPDKVNLTSSDEWLKDLPGSYSTLSDLEKTLLWYAENFRRQFRAVHPHRKALLLTCANECSIQKFVSTSIRRTLLPHAELSTWRGCARFVSDFHAYEPPTEPLLMPSHLYSPTHLLHIQRGNSFELATFLVCLLLGLGYNAYVVSGYASREQTRCDQTKRPCPYLPLPPLPPVPPPELDTSKYRPRSPPDFSSKFLEAVQDRRRKIEDEEIERREEERQRLIMELERPTADPHFGQRIHAWVVLLPGTWGPHGPEITEPIFVEPATGEARSPRDLETANVYLGVESIWNDRNYWVNMQDCTEACAKLHWNLANVKHWEHMLAGEPKEMRNVDDDEDEEVNIRRDFHMVMPASYVSRIDIPFEDYERRYPNGRKTIFYKKTKVELFAPYLREDGLVEAVTKFEDYEYKAASYVYEKYANRADGLERTEKNLHKRLTTDYYAKGRPDALKVHQYFMNSKDLVDEERTLEFYDSKRFDELSRIKMHSLYASQDYNYREDRLYNRYVEFSPFNEETVENSIHYRMMVKIVEKFHRNDEVPASKDIAVREFDFVENEIRLTYHYSEGQYTQATRTFLKPPITERGDRLVFLPQMTHGYNPDPIASPDDFDDLIDELEKQLSEEDDSVMQIRSAESEIHNFLLVRVNEYSRPTLSISKFDPSRNHEARAGLLAMEEKIIAQSQRELEEEIDFLGPYLARLGNLKYLTKNQALQVRTYCLNDFKQTSVDRANNILKDFEKYGKELEKLQSILTQSEGLTKEEKEQIFEKANKTSMILRALDERMNRHRQLVPDRYKKLLENLKHSRRISILYDH